MKPIQVKVYIAGPYTKGDVALNVANAIDAADVLINAGLVPYVPHLTHFQHMMHPRPYEDWLKLDIEWLKACDVVLRLPGKSAGADREVEIARQHNMPVFFSTTDVIRETKGIPSMLTTKGGVL